MSETRDAVSEMRSRIAQNESNARSQIQQVFHLTVVLITYFVWYCVFWYWEFFRFSEFFFLQLTVKLSDIQSNLNNISHQRQEELQSLEKSRQEHHHQEENERFKLQNKIQVSLTSRFYVKTDLIRCQSWNFFGNFYNTLRNSNQ